MLAICLRNCQDLNRGVGFKQGQAASGNVCQKKRHEVLRSMQIFACDLPAMVEVQRARRGWLTAQLIAFTAHRV